MNGSKDSNAAGVYRLSYSLLAVLLLLTVGVSIAFYKNAAEKDAVKFDANAARLQTEIENKVNLYVTLLAGVRGFITTTPKLNRSSFAGYVDSLHLQTNYPALLRVGYVQRVQASDLPAFKEYMKQVGNPDVNVTPSAEQTEYDLLSFVEPHDESAHRAIGFNLATDPDRLATLMRAADSGSAAMSGRLKPIIDTQPSSDVVAIFLPVYIEEASAKNSDAIPVGFVYTSFTPDAFINDIEKVQPEKDIAIQIYDSAENSANLLAETDREKPKLAGLFSERQSQASELKVAGRSWVTRFNSLPSFSEHAAVGWAPILFIAGTCFSFLVFGFTYNDASRRNELQKLTDKLLVTQGEKQVLLDQEQKARVEAEDANRSKDEFLAIVSHELKTPLNTIAGWTTILRSDQLSPATKDTALRKIEKNLRLQAKMVEQILDFSQIMSDQVPVNLRPVSASEIFAKAVAAVEGAAEEKTIVFNSVNELNGAVVNADPEKLGLALGNVLANAVKFTLPGGKIEARAFTRDDQVQFVVKDNGSGIDPKFLPHVFEEYKQADKPAIRSYGGLGLGLALTKHIIEMHGGKAESASPGLGKGAEFTLTLPIETRKITV